MQNLALEDVMRSHVIPIAFSSSVSHGFVDLFDLATVARNIILAPTRHNWARYELVGQNISYDEIAGIMNRLCHIEIQCDVLSPKAFIGRMKTSGEVKNECAEYAIEKMLLYYNRWQVQFPPSQYSLSLRGLALGA